MRSLIRQRSHKWFWKSIRKLNAFLKIKDRSPKQWYFAYGANLSPEVWKRRNLNFHDYTYAQLKDYQLVFDMPNEYLGKGYASIKPAKGHVVYGLALQMTKKEIAWMDILEWAKFGSYHLIDVSVEAIGPEKKTFSCLSYQSSNPRNNLYPSKKYLSLIVESCKKAKFPESYIQYLERHEFKENFELDHYFSLWNYGEHRRRFPGSYFLYKVHDKIREFLFDLI